ncbi:MAG: phage tail sheath subtilisin-like domain-containing protein [Candidatus Solibacter sp.]
MPVTPTYPGLYIEELASNAHTITAAPTSIAVFVGYTHPFKTKNFKKAVQLFSFTEYEREFGGLYASGMVDNNVAYAVNQFYLNGGSTAYVVGLQAVSLDGDGNNLGPLPQGSATVGSVKFTAIEPIDLISMNVTIDNLQNAGKVADITIAYGARAETLRGVSIDGTVSTDPTFLDNRINGLSSLVTVAPSGGAYGASFTGASRQAFTLNLGGFATSFAAKDFTDAFGQDTSLDKVQIFNLMVMPGVSDNGIWSAAIAFCERKHAFLIFDPPRQAAADSSLGLTPIANLLGALPTSANGALYFPYLRVSDPILGSTMELPPSGSVAGIFARTDVNRGVWKAPAGLETTVNNTLGVVERGVMTDERHGTLNPLGVNCLRGFPGVGTVVFGARTQMTNNLAFQQWRYVPVRRMALFLEQTLLNNLGWVVFEPNDEPLWVAIRTSIDNFMLSLFNQGAFQGSTPSKAFKVICDATTTTQQDIDLGVVNIIVAFAPLKPAEFVIIKIAQLAGQTQ